WICNATLLPKLGRSEKVGTVMVTSYPIPPVSTTAWFGCFANSVPRRWAIMSRYFSRTQNWELTTDKPRTKRPLKNGEKWIPRVLKHTRGDRNEALIGMSKLMPFPISCVYAKRSLARRLARVARLWLLHNVSRRTASRLGVRTE